MQSMFSENQLADARKIGWITLSWTILGLGIFAYDYLLMHTPYVTIQGFSWRDALFTQVMASVLAGLTGGTMTVKFFQKWLRSMPYGKALLLIFLLYTVISLGVGYCAGTVFLSRQMGQPIFSMELQTTVLSFLFGIEYLRIFSIWLVILLTTLVALLVNDKYGPGVFRDLLLGKYFSPRREERIFMFLDLRGSTTVAEQLGEEKYFEFIKDVFADATPAILRARGEIYQYIGDEILISWRMQNGLHQARCLQCFFDIKKIFADRSASYQQRYGTVPDFKAGLHCGPVMAGEVGVVKRDIAFSGDVLNTAARIQGECNGLGVDILFSNFLLEKMDLPQAKLEAKHMGEMLLRGKTEKVELWTLKVGNG